MEEMEEDPPTPFWLQSTTSSHRSGRQRRPHSDSSSILLNPAFLLLALLLPAVLLFLFLVIPSVANLFSQILRPTSVKRSWDSINLVLVIFAIICGFLGRKDEDEPSFSDADLRDLGQQSRDDQVLRPRTSSLKRSGSSYPDLRRGTSWTSEGGWPRAYDDSYIDNYSDQHRSFPDHGQHHRSWQAEDDGLHKLNKDVEVDAIIMSRFQAPAPRSMPYTSSLNQSPPASTKGNGIARHAYETNGHMHRQGVSIRQKERTKHQPPPPPVVIGLPEDDTGRSGGEVKKGKQKQRSHGNLEPLDHPSSSTPHFPPSSPPKSETKSTPETTRKPVLPAKTSSFNITDENSSSGNNSPSIPLPPPPPPFRMPSWKFVVQGDYIKIVECSSESPHSDYSGQEGGGETPPSSSEGTGSPLFCPSPDVNIKADDFINRFRAKLNLERMHSIKQIQGNGSFSPRGHDSSPSQSPGPSPVSAREPVSPSH